MSKQFIHKYKHALVLLYAFIYVPWFIYLERTVVTHYYVIHMKLDDYIPFNEVFIVPYLLWFIYCGFATFYFFFKDVKEFYRLCTFLFIGMTTFLIISTIFPNGHHLRPVIFERDNIFVYMVKQLYKADTSTNLFPSIHVYNSLVVDTSIRRSVYFKEKKWVRASSFVLCTLIIMSTVFLKQHSVFDVITAFILFSIVYPFVYRLEFIPSTKKKNLEHQFDNII